MPSFAPSSSWLLLAAWAAYALARYLAPGQTPPGFLWILNKALAAASLAAIALALLRDRAWLRPAGTWALAHGILSLALAGPRHYPTLFGADGALPFRGELALGAGILAALLWKRADGALAAALAVHSAAVMGFPPKPPGAWPLGLPPISLLCVLAIVLAWLFRRPGPAPPATAPRRWRPCSRFRRR